MIERLGERLGVAGDVMEVVAHLGLGLVHGSFAVLAVLAFGLSIEALPLVALFGGTAVILLDDAWGHYTGRFVGDDDALEEVTA
ncbi:hypothetical protein [Halarchaeum sp. P4]|uniref:hypothetical protein n=1 Tax=Halarchaeum sp. P4 TaxID=3421639 RepID=UPI003EBD7C09